MDRLKIGISACFFHPDAERSPAFGKTLQWIEQSTAHWVMRRRAAGDGAVPGRRDAVAATYASKTTRNGSTAWSCTAAPTSGRAATARSRSSRNGAATACATNTRSRWCGLRRARQAGVRHLPRPAVDQRGARRHAVPGHRHAEARRAACTATRRMYDQNFHEVDIVAGHAAWRSSCCRRGATSQQRPPPGHQGPRAGLRGRGAFARRRHRRGDPPAPAALFWPRCSGTPNSIAAARRRRRHAAARRLPAAARAARHAS